MKYNIRNREELRSAISLLETEVEDRRHSLSDHIHQVYENFLPINIARDLVKEVVTSEEFRSNILTATVGISTGYLTKKLFIKSKSGFLKKLSGNFLQYAIANLIINPSRVLKSVVFPFLDLFSGEKGGEVKSS